MKRYSSSKALRPFVKTLYEERVVIVLSGGTSLCYGHMLLELVIHGVVLVGTLHGLTLPQVGKILLGGGGGGGGGGESMGLKKYCKLRKN